MKVKEIIVTHAWPVSNAEAQANLNRFTVDVIKATVNYANTGVCPAQIASVLVHAGLLVGVKGIRNLRAVLDKIPELASEVPEIVAELPQGGQPREVADLIEKKAIEIGAFPMKENPLETLLRILYQAEGSDQIQLPPSSEVH